MKTFTANDAKTRFGEFLDLAQRQPVRVLHQERLIGVMVSAQDYEAMRVFLREPTCADAVAKRPAGQSKPPAAGCTAS